MGKAFTTRYNGISNVLKSDVLVHAAFDPKKHPTPPEGKNYTAIWDTGATGTVITQKVVTDLELKPVGMNKVHTAGGVFDRSVFLINVMLPNGVGFAGIPVTEGDITDDTDMLIGMDIIGSGDFSVSNFNGKTIFTYRHPSEKDTDFVAEINVQKGKVNLRNSIKEAIKK